jgi:hypothetical protein
MAAVRLQVVAAAASELSCSFVLADWSSWRRRRRRRRRQHLKRA